MSNTASFDKIEWTIIMKYNPEFRKMQPSCA
jgi:hypothetical protein